MKNFVRVAVLIWAISTMENVPIVASSVAAHSVQLAVPIIVMPIDQRGRFPGPPLHGTGAETGDDA